jgi:hypothetical protein
MMFPRVTPLVVVVVAAATSVDAPLAQTPHGCTFQVKVVSDSRLMINCGAFFPSGEWIFALWKYRDGWESDPPALVQSKGTATQTVVGSTDRAVTVEFPSKTLEGNADYRILITGPSPGSKPTVVAFSTAPSAEIVHRPNPRDLPNWADLMLRSAVGFDAAAPCSPCEVKAITRGVLKKDGTKTPATTITHLVSPGSIINTDVAAAGVVLLTLQQSDLGDREADLEFSGLKNVFGAQVIGEGTVGSVTPSSSADYSIEVGLEAAEGNRPSYSLDAALHPPMRSWGLTEWRVLTDLDLGHNDKQSANSIHIGTDVLFPFQRLNFGPLFGWRPAARVIYETDKDGDSRNMLGSAETNVRLKGLYKPRDVQRRSIAVRLSVRERRPVSREAVAQPDFGYVIPVKAGLDFGGSVRERTEGAGPTEVRIEKFGIARLRFGTMPVFEYKRLTVSDDFAVRWLLSKELMLDTSAARREGGDRHEGVQRTDRAGHSGSARPFCAGIDVQERSSTTRVQHRAVRGRTRGNRLLSPFPGSLASRRLPLHRELLRYRPHHDVLEVVAQGRDEPGRRRRENETVTDPLSRETGRTNDPTYRMPSSSVVGVPSARARSTGSSTPTRHIVHARSLDLIREIATSFCRNRIPCQMSPTSELTV